MSNQPGVAAGTGPRAPRGLLQWSIAAFLVLLPLGHMGSFTIRAAVASWTDVLMVVVLGVAGFELLVVAMGRVAAQDEGSSESASGKGSGPGRFTGFNGVVLLLFLFALWVGATSLWSFHPEYARLKGLGLAVFALFVAAMRWSGLGWRLAADAWLAGAALSLVVTYGVGILGSGATADGMLYLGGRVYGLPFPRVSGPFAHPNVYGDYLLLSGILLWARWPGLRGGLRTAALIFAGTLGLTVVLSFSTALVALGVLGLWWGAASVRRSAGGLMAWLAILGGGGLAAVTTAGLLYPLDLELLGISVRTAGIRPSIWSSALGAVAEAPFLGVGASPFLAEAADPLDPDQVAFLWDAHSTYISVLGQFGLVGFGLLMAAVFGLVSYLRAVRESRIHAAVLAAVVVMAVHGVFIAGEDFRHWWVLMGVAGLVGSTDRA